nr:Cj0069 family protein [Nocardioides ginsengisegetis]
MAEALREHGLHVVPVPYAEGREAGTAAALDGVDGVLVWADPLSDDGDRHGLDELLRGVAAAGVWVSAHPDTVDRLGTKEVLVATRQMSWGSDAHLYRSVEQLHAEFPHRLAADGVRVLKATRGNGGRTVWKVRLPDGPTATTPGPAQLVAVQHARIRDGSSVTMPLTRLVDTCAGAFDAWGGAGALVDQEFVSGVTSGIVRCYLVGGQVVGFARQYPSGAVPDGPLRVVPGTGPSAHEVMGLPSPKTMYPPEEPAFATLRHRLETEWVPSTLREVGLRAGDLPALWDIDLLIADSVHGEDEPRFVLCEINASSVIPFPPGAPAQVATHVAEQLTGPAPPPEASPIAY